MNQEVGYPIKEWYFAVVSDKFRSILIEILSHPKELPTLDELSVSISTESSQKHLQILIEKGILTKVSHPDHSEVFYSFTDNGKQFVCDTRMNRGSGVLKQIYNSTDFPEYIAEKQSLPRPNHPPAIGDYEEREWIWDTPEGKQAKSTHYIELFVVATVTTDSEMLIEVFDLDVFTNYPKRQLSEERVPIPNGCVETIRSDTPKTAYWRSVREPFESDYKTTTEWESTNSKMPQCTVYKSGGVTREKLGGFSFI